MNQIEQFLGVPAKRNEEIGQEVADALNGGSEATQALFQRYDAESVAVGMHFMGIMAKAQKRKSTSVPSDVQRRVDHHWDLLKHPERN